MNTDFVSMEEIYDAWQGMNDKLNKQLQYLDDLKEASIPKPDPNYFSGLSTEKKPGDAKKGDEFLETDTGVIYVYDGSKWVVKLDDETSAEKPNYYMGPSSEPKPENVKRGDEFLETDTDERYVFDGESWKKQ